MSWVKPPVYDRSPPPASFEDLKAVLAEAPRPVGGLIGDLVDPIWKCRARKGTSLRTAHGPILPVGTSVQFDYFVPDGCDGFDNLYATALGTELGDLLVRLPVGRAGDVFLLARLAIVDPSDPLANDHVAAQALHQRLVALLDPQEGDTPKANDA